MVNTHFEKKSKKIFLLEDEEALGQLYIKAMKEAGHEVLWLQSTQKVIKLAQLFVPDLILLDNTIRGEETSGIDLIPELKKVCPKTPIIILSNYDQFQLELHEQQKGSVDYLLKIDTPPAVLMKRIQETISN